MIRCIIERIGVNIIVEDDGQVNVASSDESSAQKAIDIIQELTASPELNKSYMGRVQRITDFGAFVDLGAADGLVHVSELAWQQVDHPKNIVEPGEEVKVMVIKIDRKRQRIGLSIKQLLPSPWDSVEERLTPGQTIIGKITRVLDFGAFIDLGEGIEGLLHNSQIPENAEDILSLIHI